MSGVHAESLSPVAGLLPVTGSTVAKWAWTGRWCFPVGDPRDFQSPGGREPAYHLLRNIGDPDEGLSRHQGADLGCGHGGDAVHAAASGLVVVTQRSVGSSGYGRYVVLGHRLPEGGLAYSVYAHLAAGSIPVHVGQLVGAGKRIGRVGMSGRATTPHLHFEVRLAGTPGSRWEKEEVVDPVAFVAARTADATAGDSLGEYLDWAQYAGLTEGAQSPQLVLHHSLWWRMLAVATRQRLETLPRNTDELADSLIAAGILSDAAPSPGSRVEWKDMARDLERVRKIGLRLPPRPIDTTKHRVACRRWLGVAHPSASIRDVESPERDCPTIATALLAMADLAPPLESPKPARPAKSAKPPLAHGAHSRHRARAPGAHAVSVDTASTAAGGAPAGRHP